MKKLFLFIAALCCAVMIHAQETSGTCGTNVSWNLTDGVLTISGSGDMRDYAQPTSVPWYSYASSITSVIIENGVTKIGVYAFRTCNMTQITIPNSVTCIGDGSIAKCKNLTAVTIPASVTSIGNGAFNSSSALAAITCKATVPPTLGPNVFDGCAANCVIYVPANALSAYQAADGWKDMNLQAAVPATSGSCGETMTWVFNTESGQLTLNNGGEMYDYDYNNPAPWYEYRASIISIRTWDSPTSIGDYAFEGCENLTAVFLSSTIRTIGQRAFEDCKSLESINLPMDLETIGLGAFKNCSKLSYLYIPMSVSYIEFLAFGNAGVTEFEVSENNETYCSSNKVLFNKQKTFLEAYPIANNRTDYTVPAGVTDIRDYAFLNANNLTHVDLPESLTYIGYGAFECDGLTSITCRAVTPPYLDNFAFSSSSIPVYVPSESIAAYQASTWSNYFSDFRPIDTEDIDQISNAPSAMSNKVLRNGNLYIERNGKTYNAQGAEVK